MKKFLFLIACLTLLSKSFAQTDSEKVERKTYLIIPPEPKLYMSSADREIAYKTGASHAQIREAFRTALVRKLKLELMLTDSVNTLLADTGDVFEDLRYTYYNIGYKYQPVPAEETEVKDFKKTKEFFKKLTPEKEQAQTVGVKGEEIEHFMNTSIHNPNLLKYLSEKYGASRIIFINQIDIKDEPKSAYDYADKDKLNRVVRVHFTIMSAGGTVIYAGMAKKEYPANLSSPDVIIRYAFPSIAKFIVNKAKTFDTPEIEKEEKSEIDKM
jgi:hypothetical protein